MEKIILNDGTKLEIKSVSIGALQIVVDVSKTVEELEQLFTKDNLKTLQVENAEEKVYGNFANMQCISIAKIIADGTIVINLKQLNATS